MIANPLLHIVDVRLVMDGHQVAPWRIRLVHAFARLLGVPLTVRASRRRARVANPRRPKPNAEEVAWDSM